MRLIANVKAAAFASVAAIGLLSAGGASAGGYAYSGYHGLPPGHPTAGHWASSGPSFNGHGDYLAPGTQDHAYYYGGPYHHPPGYGGGLYYAATGGYSGGDYRRSAYSAADVYVPYYVEPAYERTYVAPPTYYRAVRKQCRVVETLY